MNTSCRPDSLVIADLHRGRHLLVALKRAAGRTGPQLLLPFAGSPSGYLRTVATAEGFVDKVDAERLSRWRNQFVSSFLTEFSASVERTTRWLLDSVGPDDHKILFMVETADMKTVGHVGLGFIDWESGYAEADAIVRGEDAPTGLMKAALRCAIEWAQGQLGISSIGVRVRSDNAAVGFYKRFGFEETRRTPLRRITEPGMVRWTESSDSTAEVQLIHMLLN